VNLTVFILSILAAVGLATAISEMPFGPLRWFRTKVSTLIEKDWWRQFWHCPTCLSFWFALFFVLFGQVWPHLLLYSLFGGLTAVFVVRYLKALTHPRPTPTMPQLPMNIGPVTSRSLEDQSNG
jgi:hypothetical protein